MPAVTLPGRRASVRAVPGKHASGPSRRNVPTGPGRCRRLCRSTSPLVSSGGGCTVEATVARYYDPTTAQFLTRDPLEDITGKPYEYAENDPLDKGDPAGLASCGVFQGLCDATSAVGNTLGTAAHGVEYVTLEGLSIPVYANYYVTYEAGRTINAVGSKFGIPGCVIGHILALPLVPDEAAGLGGDVLLDLLKNRILHNGESIRDEGVVGPLFGNGLKKHGFDPKETYLPGVDHNGSIQFEW